MDGLAVLVILELATYVQNLLETLIKDLGKLSKQMFGKSWEFGPTGLTPAPLPERWDFSVNFSEIFGKKGSNMP